MPRRESRFFVPLILEKAHALWAFEHLEATKSYKVEFSKEAVDFYYNHQLAATLWWCEAHQDIISKSKSDRCSFCFFVLGFQLHFFRLDRDLMHFHFLDSQKNRRVWRPVQLGPKFREATLPAWLLWQPLTLTFWGTERGLKRCGHPQKIWAPEFFFRITKNVMFQKCSLCMFNGLSLLYQLALGFFSLGEVLVVDGEKRNKNQKASDLTAVFQKHLAWLMISTLLDDFPINAYINVRSLLELDVLSWGDLYRTSLKWRKWLKDSDLLEGYMIYGNDMNMRVAIGWGFLIKMCAWCLEYQDSKKISYIRYLY